MPSSVATATVVRPPTARSIVSDQQPSPSLRGLLPTFAYEPSSANHGIQSCLSSGGSKQTTA